MRLWLKIIDKLSSIILFALVVFVGVIVCLEFFVRVFDFDWKFIKKAMYYQTNQLRIHQPDQNPKLLYRLRPGYHPQVGGLYINSMGARSPERAAKKPEGIFRIIVVGASNVLGASPIKDNETWPAQLEQRLNEIHPGRYEVWNFGAHAYVAQQMTIIAKEMVEKLDPDLIIIGPANIGIRPFLWTAPLNPYFERNPALWSELFPERAFSEPKWLTLETKQWLAGHLRLYRYGLLMLTHYVFKERPWKCNDQEYKNVKAVKNLILQTKERTQITLFIGPHQAPERFSHYYEEELCPAMILQATEDLGPEYKKAHPPKEVYSWYADHLSKWLLDNHLLGEKGA